MQIEKKKWHPVFKGNTRLLTFQSEHFKIFQIYILLKLIYISNDACLKELIENLLIFIKPIYYIESYILKRAVQSIKYINTLQSNIKFYL